MVWFPLLSLEEVVAFACCAVAATATAGRLATTAMLALAAKNLRRDVTRSIEVACSFIGLASNLRSRRLVTRDHRYRAARGGLRSSCFPRHGRQLSFTATRIFSGVPCIPGNGDAAACKQC